MYIPEGFKPIAKPIGFDKAFGQIYVKHTDDGPVMGIEVLPHLLNFNGTLHGGALAVFADWQCFAVKSEHGFDGHTPTVNLDIDYLAPAAEGDWLECYPRLDKKTGSFLFTSAEFYVGETIIARSKAIYKITKTPGYTALE